MYEWNPEWNVGNATLDEDHKSFFTLTGLLHEASQYGDFDALIQSAIGLLKDYLSGHFQREERAMRAVDFPDIEDHIAEHLNFEVQVRKAIAEYEGGDASAAGRLAQTAADWVANHIQTFDFNYIAWIKDAEIDTRSLDVMAGSVLE